MEKDKEIICPICGKEKFTQEDGFKIGHSYFCPDIKDRKGNKKDIQDIINYEIIPLLEEYWYDDEDSLVQWENALNGVINDD